MPKKRFQENAKFEFAMDIIRIFNDRCIDVDVAEELLREVNSLLIYRWPTLSSLPMPCKENCKLQEDVQQNS